MTGKRGTMTIMLAPIGETALRDPWDASPPTWTSRGPSVFGPLQLLRLVIIFRWALLKAYSASPDKA